ncbi:MAG: hypothetical protein QX199_13465 [Methylococcaceae bacterium]
MLNMPYMFNCDVENLTTATGYFCAVPYKYLCVTMSAPSGNAVEVRGLSRKNILCAGAFAVIDALSSVSTINNLSTCTIDQRRTSSTVDLSLRLPKRKYLPFLHKISGLRAITHRERQI